MEDHQKLVLNMARSWLKKNENYAVDDKEIFEILRKEFPEKKISFIGNEADRKTEMDVSDFAKRKAAQVWCKESTKNKVMDIELCEAMAETIEELTSQAWLGNATTRELLEEIKTRIELGAGCNVINKKMIGRNPLDYKTTDNE